MFFFLAHMFLEENHVFSFKMFPDQDFLGTSFFPVTFWSPKWRSLNPWKGHLTHPKRSLGRTWKTISFQTKLRPPSLLVPPSPQETKCTFSLTDVRTAQLQKIGYESITWRIIPFSKWLITMVSKSPKWSYSPSKWPKWLINRAYYPLTKWDDPPSS